MGLSSAVLTGSSVDGRAEPVCSAPNVSRQPLGLAAGSQPLRPFLRNFVRQDVNRLRVGVEPPVEPEAFAPLVLAPQRDLERPNILFIEKRGDELACRALLELQELA